MKLNIVLGVLFAWSMVAPRARADSACIDSCPPIIEGDCSQAKAGEPCANGSGTCQTPYGGCGLPERTDAGVTLLYCTAPPRPCDDDGGCSIGVDPMRAARRIGFPSALVAGGILLLALDRRRGERGRSKESGRHGK